MDNPSIFDNSFDNSFDAFSDREPLVAQARKIIERFGNFMQGKHLDYEKLQQELSQILPQLESLAADDKQLLEHAMDSISIYEKLSNLRASFSDLKLVLNLDPSVLERSSELHANILRAFVRSFDAFDSSELDPLYSIPIVAEMPRDFELTEGTDEERLLRELVSQVAYSCQSLVILSQCTTALELIEALRSKDAKAICTAGGNYAYALARLRLPLLLEPPLTTMAGRTFGSMPKGPSTQSL